MKTISALVIVIGLGLAPAGCVFHPDMGEWEKCDLDSDCDGLGDCACVEGKCVPAYDGAGCASASECETPEIPCGDTCVDVTDDPDHCGRCDHPCDSPPPATCDEDGQGNVVAVTYAPVGTCDAGDCRYTPTSQDCPFGCEAGECLEGCQPGDCDPGEVCTEGFCRCGGDGPDCDSGQLCCGSVCVDPMTDDTNCGDCGIDCTTPPPAKCVDAETLKVKTAGPCSQGACQFSEEFTQCPSGCQDDHCVDDPCGGSCNDPPAPWCNGNELVEPVPVGECVNGVCEYPADTSTFCEFGCDPDAAACLPQCTTDADCGPNETCFNNDCRCGSNPQCTADQACCGGACVFSASDPEHCGGCNQPCYLGLPNVWSAECSYGNCEYTCDGGMANCNQDLNDGCEADTLMDPGNCGGCGTLCGVDSCVDGECLPIAEASNVQCGPGESCGPGEFCCVGVDNQWCSGNDTVGNCDAGHVLLCDGTSDCPDGTVCCFDQDTLNTTCVVEGACVSGFVACDDGDCADGTTCNTIQLNNSVAINLCQP